MDIAILKVRRSHVNNLLGAIVLIRKHLPIPAPHEIFFHLPTLCYQKCETLFRHLLPVCVKNNANFTLQKRFV